MLIVFGNSCYQVSVSLSVFCFIVLISSEDVRNHDRLLLHGSSRCHVSIPTGGFAFIFSCLLLIFRSHLSSRNSRNLFCRIVIFRVSRVFFVLFREYFSLAFFCLILFLGFHFIALTRNCTSNSILLGSLSLPLSPLLSLSLLYLLLHLSCLLFTFSILLRRNKRPTPTFSIGDIFQMKERRSFWIGTLSLLLSLYSLVHLKAIIQFGIF